MSIGFLPKFTYELFVSYAVGTNVGDSSTEKLWVSELCQRLQASLNQACPGIRIFFDSDCLPGNAQFVESLETAVKNSACFLAIVNPLYTDREYCKKECAWFQEATKRRGENNRVFVLFHRPTQSENLPHLLQCRRGFRFYNNDQGSPSFRQPYRHIDHGYQTALDELLGAIEMKLVDMRAPNRDRVSLLTGDFAGRRVRARMDSGQPAAVLKSMVDEAHYYFSDKLDTLRLLVQLADDPTSNGVWASGLFSSLVDFSNDNSPSLDKLGTAIREFAVNGFPRGISGIIGVCCHEFIDQLVNSVIRSVFEAKIERPKRELPEDWFYDYYIRTFAACWEDYKPIFRAVKVLLDFDDLRAHLMAEHLRTQIRLCSTETRNT